MPFKLRGRRLARSQTISHHNTGSLGAGFVYAVDNSVIAFKGQNLQFNKGIEGGVILLRDSSFNMEDSVVEGQVAKSYGGFMSAINSRFNIRISIIEQG